jgi:hypothetical protein
MAHPNRDFLRIAGEAFRTAAGAVFDGIPMAAKGTKIAL